MRSNRVILTLAAIFAVTLLVNATADAERKILRVRYVVSTSFEGIDLSFDPFNPRRVVRQRGVRQRDSAAIVPRVVRRTQQSTATGGSATAGSATATTTVTVAPPITTFSSNGPTRTPFVPRIPFIPSIPSLP